MRPSIAETMLCSLVVLCGCLKDSRSVKLNADGSGTITVTLLEMDFDKMLGDPPKLKKAAGAQPKSLDEAKALIKDFPGVKVCLEPEIRVEFRAD